MYRMFRISSMIVKIAAEIRSSADNATIPITFKNAMATAAMVRENWAKPRKSHRDFHNLLTNHPMYGPFDFIDLYIVLTIH